MGGMNQLWRNQLLTASIETSSSPRWPYKKVFFSVVHHPKNNALQPSMRAFQALLNDPEEKHYGFSLYVTSAAIYPNRFIFNGHESDSTNKVSLEILYTDLN